MRTSLSLASVLALAALAAASNGSDTVVEASTDLTAPLQPAPTMNLMDRIRAINVNVGKSLPTNTIPDQFRSDSSEVETLEVPSPDQQQSADPQMANAASVQPTSLDSEAQEVAGLAESSVEDSAVLGGSAEEQTKSRAGAAKDSPAENTIIDAQASSLANTTQSVDGQESDSKVARQRRRASLTTTSKPSLDYNQTSGTQTLRRSQQTPNAHAHPHGSMTSNESVVEATTPRRNDTLTNIRHGERPKHDRHHSSSIFERRRRLPKDDLSERRSIVDTGMTHLGIERKYGSGGK